MNFFEIYAVASSRLSGPYLNQQYTVDQFENATKTFLKLNAEQIKWRTRVHNRKAMSLISTAQVKHQIKKALTNN
ncbi:MAG: hypothetical protein HWD86_10140 [Kangiellaceae bacterium]|nr:hypothetical protein [Kangiellaceae bacterium]